MGRAAEAGDDRGSRVIAARLARELMRLCLLLAGCFPPYSKWLGTSFATAPGTADIAAAIDEALRADSDAARQAALCSVFEAAGDWQNRLRLAEPVDSCRRPFFDRPYQVIDAGRFAAALLSSIDDPGIAGLPPVGAVDQFSDSTALLCSPRLARALMTAVWQAGREGRSLRH